MCSLSFRKLMCMFPSLTVSYISIINPRYAEYVTLCSKSLQLVTNIFPLLEGLKDHSKASFTILEAISHMTKGLKMSDDIESKFELKIINYFPIKTSFFFLLFLLCKTVRLYQTTIQVSVCLKYCYQASCYIMKISKPLAFLHFEIFYCPLYYFFNVEIHIFKIKISFAIIKCLVHYVTSFQTVNMKNLIHI